MMPPDDLTEHDPIFRLPLSVVILAKNEAMNIERCVRSLSWAADVVVIDDNSTDGTGAIAEACGARVVQHPFESFAQQRNWAMEFADVIHDWVLHLDADEVCTPELQAVLSKTIQNAANDTVAYRMCRRTMLNGQWLKYSDGFPVWIMRLVRNGRAKFHDSGHGEVAVPLVDGNMGTIHEPFLHYAFSKGLANWIDRHNRYSTDEAELELSSVALMHWQDVFSFDKALRRRSLQAIRRNLPFRPTLRFLYQYVLKRGFLDGRAGWKFSRLMAMYESWIVLKREELQRHGKTSRPTKVEVPVVIQEPVTASR